MRDGRRREIAAESHRRHHQRARPEQRARIQHGIAADFRPVADDRAEFPQTRLVNGPAHPHDDRLLVEPQVGTNHPGAQVRAVAQDRIAHIAEMRHLHAVHQHAVLELAGVPEDAALAHDHVAPDKRPGANFRLRSDPNRADDRRVGRQFDARMNEHQPLGVHPRPAGRQRRLKTLGGQRRANPFQPLPRGHVGRKMRRKGSQRRRQCEKIRGFHAATVHKNPPRGKRDFHPLPRLAPPTNGAGPPSSPESAAPRRPAPEPPGPIR